MPNEINPNPKRAKFCGMDDCKRAIRGYNKSGLCYFCNKERLTKIREKKLQDSGSNSE